jgi:hypothetical protein
MADKVVKCRLMPADQDLGRGRAQVVCYAGEDSRRRSCNRHIVREGRVWIGNNPDYRAVPANEYAKAAVETAAENLGKAMTLLAELGEINKRNKAYRDQAKLVTGLELALKEAEENKKKVEQEFPLRLEFKF